MASLEQSLVLIDSAKSAGVISEAASQALGKVNPKKLLLGSPIYQYKGNEVLLATLLIDDSGSLNVTVYQDEKTGRLMPRTTSPDDPKSNAEAVRIGYNAVIQALLDSEKPSAIWFHTRYLNGKELNPWDQLEKAVRMDRNNYNPYGGTPFYDETVVILGSTLAKTQQFEDKWKTVRTATLLVTDGDDRDSKLQTPASVKEVISDMYNTGIHIIAAMGIYDGSTDFRKVFMEMGVRENMILTPGSTSEEIMKAFGLFGKMATRAADLRQFDDMLAHGFLALPPG